jgi:hypothetical protein
MKTKNQGGSRVLAMLASMVMTCAACSPDEAAENVAQKKEALVASCSLEVNVVATLGDANPPPTCQPLSVNPSAECSLRGAFQLAVNEAINGCGVVANVAAGTYALTAELELPRGDLTLLGAGADTTVITTTAPCAKGDCDCANGASYRIINALGDAVAPLSLSLSHLSVRGGRNPLPGAPEASNAAGGIVMFGGRFTASHVVIEDNHASGRGAGLAVYSSELMRLTDSVIRDNYNDQTVRGSDGACNASGTSGGLTGPGGGIHANNVAEMEIVNSALVGNMAADGGAMYISGGGSLTVQNSTISGNRAGGLGGGGLIFADVTRFYFNTFSANVASDSGSDRGAAFRISAGQFTGFGNVMAGNTFTRTPPAGSSPDCSFNDGVTFFGGVGFNLVGRGGDDCLPLGDPNVDPLIGSSTAPLEAGLVDLPVVATSTVGLVHQLETSSPALNAYPVDSALPSDAPRCPLEDQRRFVRGFVGTCDLGAYEVGALGIGATCSPGQIDYWCCSETGDTTLEVNVSPSIVDADLTVPCVPLSADPNAQCSVRGAFRLAAVTGDNGCHVVANVAAGTHAVAAELRLPAGNLTLSGAGSASTTITTTGSTCIDNPQSCNEPSCSVLATHRLVNATAEFGAPLSLEIDELTLKGGHDLSSGGTFDTGGGAILIDGGSLVAHRAVIDDNRAFGFGAGISVIRSPLLRLTDCVVRNNINTQVGCNFTGTGGHTGLGGGVFAFGVDSVEIANSAIVGNVGSQGGGIAVEGGGPLVIENTTIGDNVAAGFGGGLLSSVPTTLNFNTVAFNFSATDNGLNAADKRGGGITIQGTGSSIFAHGNIFANNIIVTGTVANAPDCNIQPSASIVGANFNLIASGGRDCSALGDPNDPLIGSNTEFLSAGLDFNLPETPVTSSAIFHALQTGSPALDAYPAAASLPAASPACPGVDQRRQLRPGGALCDLGAVEVGALLESDDDGMANDVDVQPFVFSSEFSDVGNSGVTSGTIVDRAGHIVTVRDSALPSEGVVITVSSTGGTLPVRISACDGTVELTLEPGESTVLTCEAPLCVLGEANVDLRDRVVVNSNVGAGSYLELGAPATLNGNGLSGGNALIRDNGFVDGHLILGGTLSAPGPFTITGTLTENGDPALPTLETKTFPTGSGSQTIVFNTTLAPGNRGHVTIRSGKTVTLNAGVYNFASLNIETDVNLVANGAVEVNVQGDFQFGDRSDVIGGAGLTVYANGGFVRIGTDATFSGVLVAPNASLIVSSRTDLVGCIGAENVTFDTDVTLVDGGRSLSVVAPQPMPLSATLSVQADWGSGYCAHLEVTNEAASPTTTWNVALNTNGSTITESWNGVFSGSTGSVGVTPGFSWNQSIAPGATNDSVGFCANRPSGAGTAVVTGASGSF